MNVIIEDKDLQLLLNGESSKKYKKLAKDVRFMDKLYETYSTLLTTPCTEQLSQFSNLRYEKLKYEYSGYSSVRIMNGRVERLIFTEHEGGITIKLIELNQDHYGNK
jgi:Txe/YoeB family toxin of Txe-Axe toxin-antitoxin module